MLDGEQSAFEQRNPQRRQRPPAQVTTRRAVQKRKAFGQRERIGSRETPNHRRNNVPQCRVSPWWKSSCQTLDCGSRQAFVVVSIRTVTEVRTFHGSQRLRSKLHSSRLSNARVTTTQYKHSTELAFCPRCHSALAWGQIVGPGINTRNTSTTLGWRTGGSSHGHPRYCSTTQWEGCGWPNRTHQHMALKHATDTNEPETERSQTRIW